MYLDAHYIWREVKGFFVRLRVFTYLETIVKVKRIVRMSNLKSLKFKYLLCGGNKVDTISKKRVDLNIIDYRKLPVG